MTLRETCPVCGMRWQFIHEHGDQWFLAHYCEVVKGYVFWNRTYFYFTHTTHGGA